MIGSFQYFVDLDKMDKQYARLTRNSGMTKLGEEVAVKIKKIAASLDKPIGDAIKTFIKVSAEDYKAINKNNRGKLFTIFQNKMKKP